MNNFRQIKKNARALSPVVASIILIAVTVAVSVAVAAWMGGMTVGFMDTEQVNVATPAFNVEAGTVTVSLRNSGTSAVVIQSVYLNGADVTDDVAVTSVDPPAEMPVIIQPNADATIAISATIAAGDNYQIKVLTAKNNPFMISAIAPS